MKRTTPSPQTQSKGISSSVENGDPPTGDMSIPDTGVVSNVSGFEQKLLKSDAVQSLDQELRVKRILRDLGWTANIGHFYKDPIEGKERELDVLASRRWKRGPSHDRRSCSVMVLVECKTLREYNVILAPEQREELTLDYERPEFFWAGSQYEEPESVERDIQLRQLLVSAGVAADEIRRIFREFTHYAYPRGNMRMWHFVVHPIAPTASGCAFRETNSDKSKDLDASVVWKAGRGLRSAILGIKRLGLELVLSDFKTTLKYAQEYRKNVSREVLRELQGKCNFIRIFFPVLVVDAQLWTYDLTTRLRPAEWFRLHQRNPMGSSSFWFDVVNVRSVESYFNSLTKSIQSSLASVKARPERSK